MPVGLGPASLRLDLKDSRLLVGWPRLGSRPLVMLRFQAMARFGSMAQIEGVTRFVALPWRPILCRKLAPTLGQTEPSIVRPAPGRPPLPCAGRDGL